MLSSCHAYNALQDCSQTEENHPSAASIMNHLIEFNYACCLVLLGNAMQKEPQNACADHYYSLLRHIWSTMRQLQDDSSCLATNLMAAAPRACMLLLCALLRYWCNACRRFATMQRIHINKSYECISVVRDSWVLLGWRYNAPCCCRTHPISWSRENRHSSSIHWDSCRCCCIGCGSHRCSGLYAAGGVGCDEQGASLAGLLGLNTAAAAAAAAAAE
jgi:hypothetical protein